VNKVTLWYGELFHHLAISMKRRSQEALGFRFTPPLHHDVPRGEFHRPKLEERLNDLTEQGIFKPEMMIIDGLHCEETLRPALVALKALAGKMEMPVGSPSIRTGTKKRARMGCRHRFSP